MNNMEEIQVSSLQSLIYGPLLGQFLAIRESGLEEDAENFVALANAQPCWSGDKSVWARERRRRNLGRPGSCGNGTGASEDAPALDRRKSETILLEPVAEHPVRVERRSSLWGLGETPRLPQSMRDSA